MKISLKSHVRFIKNKLAPHKVQQQKKTVFDTICEILRKDCLPSNNSQPLTKDTEFAYDLGLSSLDISELGISLEKIYGIIIDEPTSNIYTIGDLCNITETKVYIKKTLDKNNRNFAKLKLQILNNLIEILYKNRFVSEHKQKDVTPQSALAFISKDSYKDLTKIIKEKFDIDIRYYVNGMKTVNDLYKFVEYKTFEKNISLFNQQAKSQIQR